MNIYVNEGCVSMRYPIMAMNEILQKISKLMQEREWTYYRLAKEADISYLSLNSLFLKNSQPTISTLEKICAGFHISLSDFFSSTTPYCPESYRFTKDEKDMIEMYRSLNKSEKKVVTAYLKGFCRILL